MAMTTIRFACVLALGLGGLAACGPRAREGSGTREAWDPRNRPEIFGMHSLRYEELTDPRALQGVASIRPWRDSYWPYYERGMAFRPQDVATARAFASFDAQAADARGHGEDPTLSPAEKYDLVTGDDGFGLTGESWRIWRDYTRDFGPGPGTWRWTGVCSGWAPASITEPAPRSHVLARGPGGREVLFFAGDVRGLLSKVYDVNAMTGPTDLVGDRCDARDAAIPRDAQGRPVDGRFAATGITFFLQVDRTYENGVFAVRTNHPGDELVWLMADGPIANLQGSVNVWRYANRDDLRADLAANTRGQRASGGQVEVVFFKACRDVNPATYHIALTRSLSDAVAQKRPFVTELSRSIEVWNHPVIGFRATIQAPRPVRGDDEARAFRAPGTAYVADVLTRIVYVVGSEALVDPPEGEDAPIDLNDLSNVNHSFGVATFAYSLEFNAEGYLIGGEWQERPEGIAAPDFFWRPSGVPTDRTKSGEPSPIKYSVVKKLAECSTRAPDRRVSATTRTGATVDVAAVTCPL